MRFCSRIWAENSPFEFVLKVEAIRNLFWNFKCHKRPRQIKLKAYRDSKSSQRRLISYVYGPGINITNVEINTEIPVKPSNFDVGLSLFIYVLYVCCSRELLVRIRLMSYFGPLIHFSPYIRFFSSGFCLRIQSVSGSGYHKYFCDTPA